MTCRVKSGGTAPSFSCQAIVSSPCVADRTSMSPSPSTSAARTEVAPIEVAHTLRGMKIGSSVSSFTSSVCSYQATPQLSTGDSAPTTGTASREAESTSTSPSPSMSAAKTDAAPRAETEIRRLLNVGGVPPSFSCQAIVLSRNDAESTSTSPSPSMSMANTESGRASARPTVRGLKIGVTPRACSNQSTASSSRDEPTTSVSSSPSRSAAKTHEALSSPSVTRCALKFGVLVGSFGSQSFSNQ